MLPSERLRLIPEAKAELVDANPNVITVKITPPADDAQVQSNIINLQNARINRKRHKKARYMQGLLSKNPYKNSTLNGIKEEVHEPESDMEAHGGYLHYNAERHNKRIKKMHYKRNRDAMLLDTPPTLYRLGNMVKPSHRHDMYAYDGGFHGYEPHGGYYVIPSAHVPHNPYQNYESGYYQGHPSPMIVRYDRKRTKERFAQFYPPFYGMPPVGICPGCGGKTALIPSKTPAKQPPAHHHEDEPDFLEKISPGAFTPLRSKHGSDSKHSSGEIMYPNFLSPTQALKKTETHLEDKQHKEEKMMYNFSISDSKNPYRRSPTPIKRDIKYSASGAKIYKEDVAVPELNNQLFSNDLVDDENNKSPFAFLKKSSLQSHLGGFGMRNREAFNNITNTLNKSPHFEEKESSRRNIEN
jgi:hypothetical protein